jgi:ribonucleotide monophosphatase NagD (HAD superfamily)
MARQGERLMINAILFDLSGVLYEGDTAIPGALHRPVQFM